MKIWCFSCLQCPKCLALVVEHYYKESSNEMPIKRLLQNYFLMQPCSKESDEKTLFETQKLRCHHQKQ